MAKVPISMSMERFTGPGDCRALDVVRCRSLAACGGETTIQDATDKDRDERRRARNPREIRRAS